MCCLFEKGECGFFACNVWARALSVLGVSVIFKGLGRLCKQTVRFKRILGILFLLLPETESFFNGGRYAFFFCLFAKKKE